MKKLKIEIRVLSGKTKFLFISLLINVLQTLLAQSLCAQNYFQKGYYQTNANEYVESVEKVAVTNYGNIYATGIYVDDPFTPVDLSFLLKLKPNGDTLWSRFFLNSMMPVAMCVDSNENVYIATTGSASYLPSTITKIDSSGNLVWSKSYGDTANNVPEQILLNSNSRISLISKRITSSSSYYGGDMYSFQIDSAGNLISVPQMLSHLHSSNGTSAINDKLNQVYFAFEDSVNSSYPIGIAKQDNSGNIVWAKNFGSALSITNIFFSKDSNLVIGGLTWDNFNNYLSLTKIDTLGNVIFSKLIKMGVYAIKFISTIDSGYAILAQYSIGHPAGPDDPYPYIIKLDSGGNIEWAKVFNDSLGLVYFSGGDLMQATNGDFIISGLSYSPSTYNGFVSRGDSLLNNICYLQNFPVTDSTVLITSQNIILNQSSAGTSVVDTINFTSGVSILNICSTVGINEHFSPKSSITIYPNPLTSSSTLQLTTQLKDADVTIYDMLGHEMMRKRFSGNKMEIEKGKMESGVYFVKVTCPDSFGSGDERQWVEKMVVE